ncbi:hypothetical protein SAMN02745148_02459 [Modicisalibacter ilicicola DSM 19980]|uniref:Toxin VasX N-terminal region domain-containing protein n=1 Tax=Modicisalibacter ilicicola DSM 19980 TaxID=1121942 RepID=A0A1M5B3Y7_9GAMM|nr:toxin VasX [Halomonas ilicicola]SHF37150.1 hypothetical protein SAMN02745148_02459 [Halomonas ilicicola DSM 19980]
MTSFQRPADDRHDGALAAYEQPCRDSEEGANCPLLERKVQLLPLRYGIVEELLPGIGMPYTLDARPLGIRLLRNGYLYVLDSTDNSLAEYEFRDQGNTISGKLEYQTDRTLYVGFSEVPWTERKRAQVRNSTKDRDAFMQMVDLSGANPITGGGAQLITTSQAEQWVAEFAEDVQPAAIEDGHEQEGEPYHWENEPYYHKTRLGKLLKQHRVADRDECLCLILRDDLGVMRDLANHQDHVVDWVETWANENDGRTERDYLLGCYIESITQLSSDELEALASAEKDTERQPMWDDLTAMDDTSREQTRQSILDYLNDNTPLLRPNDPDLPSELRAQILENSKGVDRADYAYQGGSADYRDVIQRRQATTIQRYQARQALQEADPGFVGAHLDRLVNAKREHDRRVHDILEGANFGQRGINELINRPRMDAFVDQQREKLARWNTLLDRITADRVDMLCSDRFHVAAWHFDAQDNQQLEAAFAAEYSCMRDICRSDEANEQIYAWLEDNPHNDRPLLYTLSLEEQTTLTKQYADIFAAGYKVITNAPEWLEKLKNIEHGSLPDIASLPENVHALADGARANLNPALGIGIAKALEPLYQVTGHALPPLEALFRPMPRLLAARILDATARGDFEFQVSSTEELHDFRATLQRVLGLRERLLYVNRRHDQTKARRGHRSAEARDLLGERRAIQRQLATQEEALARALSPVADSSGERISLAEGSAGRAGLTLVLPANQQQHVSGMVRNLRQGINSAPRMALAGDGLALAIFMVQAVNLWGAIEALNQLSNRDGESPDYLARKRQAWAAFFATGAAGFLAAQGVGHTALSTQARVLGQALQKTASEKVYTQLGKLHLGLGFAGYGAGFLAAGYNLYSNHGNWQSAVRSGNHKAQGAALLAMSGNASMMGAYGYGFGSNVLAGLAVRSGKITWAMAGARLANVFGRVNLIGLAATVLELGGTWLYNRHNLSAHDTWLQHTPWGQEAGDESLDYYLQTLRASVQPTHITLEPHYADTGMGGWFNHATRWARDPSHYTLKLTLPSITRQMLQAPLDGQAPVRLSFRVSLVQPAKFNQRTGITLASERWVPTESLTDALTLRLATDQPGISLVGAIAAHERTSHGYKTEHIVVGIRVEWLDGTGSYGNPSDQTIYLDPAGGTGPDKRYTPGDVDIRRMQQDWQRLDIGSW